MSIGLPVRCGHGARDGADRCEGGKPSNSAGYTLETDASLRALNTFGVEARAAGLVTVHESGALAAALAGSTHRRTGRSSASVTAATCCSSVISRACTATGGGWRRVVEDIGATGRVRAEAGCAWDPLVDWTISHGLAGLENLALIPGLVGAAPIQNIGAYGTEIDEFIDDGRSLGSRDRTTVAARHARIVALPTATAASSARSIAGSSPPSSSGCRARRAPRLDYPGVREELGPLRQRAFDAARSPPPCAASAAASCRIRP